jgi:hypothetical protein
MTPTARECMAKAASKEAAFFIRRLRAAAAV